MMASPAVSIIVAATPRGAIGRAGDMLYHISADLKRFKAITLGKPVIMGRKTFDSLPSGALPGRRNIVITRNAVWSAPGAERASSLDDALRLCADLPEAMIIGGATIYEAALPLASRIYLTLIDAEPDDADTFITPLQHLAGWTVTEESAPAVDPRSGATYRFIDLTKTQQ